MLMAMSPAPCGPQRERDQHSERPSFHSSSLPDLLWWSCLIRSWRIDENRHSRWNTPGNHQDGAGHSRMPEATARLLHHSFEATLFGEARRNLLLGTRSSRAEIQFECRLGRSREPDWTHLDRA